MNKRLLAVTLALPWLCLLGWVLFLTASANSGKQITLPVTGYDPRDLLSGRYIAYQIDLSNIEFEAHLISTNLLPSKPLKFIVMMNRNKYFIYFELNRFLPFSFFKRVFSSCLASSLFSCSIHPFS